MLKYCSLRFCLCLPMVASGIIAQIYVYITYMYMYALLYEVIFCLWFNAYLWCSMLTCGSQCGDTATCITLDFYIFRVQKIYQWVHYSKPHQYFFIIFYKKKNKMIKLHVNACILKNLLKNPVGLFGLFFSPFIISA